MQLLYEILPLALFFAAFKMYGIYVATTVGIIATFLQVVIFRLLMGYWDKKQAIAFGIFCVFGGMTLYFHNPIFVKWKPTIVFWIFALVILIHQYFAKKPLMQRLMENMVEGKEKKGIVPSQIWQRLNIIWAGFFLILGSVNLYVAYYYSLDAWVDFKVYGVTSALIVFSVLQAMYLMRHFKEENK